MGKKNGLKRYEEPAFLKKLAKQMAAITDTTDDEIMDKINAFKSIPQDKRLSVLEAARKVSK